MKHIMTTDPAVTPAQARALLRQWYLATPRTPRTVSASGGSPAAAAGPPGSSSPPGVVLDLARAGSGELEARAWADDRAFLAWADVGGGASVIAAELKARRSWQLPLNVLSQPQSCALQCSLTFLTCWLAACRACGRQRQGAPWRASHAVGRVARACWRAWSAHCGRTPPCACSWTSCCAAGAALRSSIAGAAAMAVGKMAETMAAETTGHTDKELLHFLLCSVTRGMPLHVPCKGA